MVAAVLSAGYRYVSTAPGCRSGGHAVGHVREANPAYGVAVQGEAPEDHGVIEAGSLNELIQSLHGTGNQVRVRLIEALRTLHDERSARPTAPGATLPERSATGYPI